MKSIAIVVLSAVCLGFGSGIQAQTATVVVIANPSGAGTITGGGVSTTGTRRDIPMVANAGWYIQAVNYSGPPDTHYHEGLPDEEIFLNPQEQFAKELSLLQVHHINFPDDGFMGMTNFTASLYVNGDASITAQFSRVSPTTLFGVVYDDRGQPIPAAKVSVGGMSTICDNGGVYALTKLSAGDYIVTVNAAGYVTYSGTLTIAPSARVAQSFALQPARATGSTPNVTSVNSKYLGNVYFLDGVNFPVTFTANIDWAGHPPGVVRFMTPKAGSWDVMTSGQTASKKIDVGSAFGPGGQLQVMAIGGDGSASVVAMPLVFVMTSLPTAFSFQPVDEGDHFHYESRVAAALNLIDDALPNGAEVDSSMPLFGGKSLDLAFRPTLDVKVTGSHLDLVQLEITPSIANGSVEDGSVDTSDTAPTLGMAGLYCGLSSPVLSVFADYKLLSSDWQWGGSLEVGGNVGFSTTTYLPLPISVPVFAKVDLNLSADAVLSLLNLNPVSWNGTLALSPTVTGTLGAGIDDVAAVAGWVKGGATLSFQYPQTPHFQSYELDLSAGVTAYIHLWIINPTWDAQLFSWTWPNQNPSSQIFQALNAAKTEAFKPYPRDYLAEPRYAAFKGHQTVRPRPLGLHGGARNAFAYPLQSHVFPFSEPSIDASGSNCYAVWLYDDPNRSLNNRTMLVFSQLAGMTWSSFTTVADDGTADFHPQLRVFSDGSAVVAWENEGAVLATNATFADMTKNLGIALAFYEPLAGGWQPMQLITTNGYLERSPRIAGTTRTNLVLTWVANPANDLEGSATNVNQLWFATWNGASRSQPQMFAVVPYPMLKYDLAYDGTSANLVMSVASDDALTNVNAHELFQLEYQNGSWGGLQRLTDDQVPDDNPQMGVDPNGHRLLVWLKGGELSSVMDFDFSQREVLRTNQYSSNLGDFKLAIGSDGRLAVIWAEPSDNSSDLWGMFYDPSLRIWGGREQLTDDPQTEMGTAVTFYPSNQLMAIYDRLDIAVGTNQFGSVITNADLYALQYQLTNDLALAANSLILTPANPLPGSSAMLQVTVQNLGDQPVAGFMVAFYRGDPVDGGQQIGATNVAGLLAPGDTANVAIIWNVPLTTNSLTIYALLDPRHELSDNAPLNNQVSAIFLEPDLAIASLTSSQITSNLLSLTARVVNRGAVLSLPTTVNFWLNGLGGTNLFTADVPALNPGESIDANCLWDVTGLDNNLNLLAAINFVTNTIDFDPQNNNLQLTIQRTLTQPSLELGPVTPLSDGAVQIMLTGLVGQTYPIQASTDLVNWTMITNLALTNLPGVFIDSLATNHSKRFYRALTPQNGETINHSIEAR